MSIEFIYSQRGHPLIVLDNYLYRKNRGKYWRCLRCTKYQCRARLNFTSDRHVKVLGDHTHGKESEKIEWGRQVCSALKTRCNANKLDLQSKVKLFIRQPHFKTDDSRRMDELEYVCADHSRHNVNDVDPNDDGDDEDEDEAFDYCKDADENDDVEDNDDDDNVASTFRHLRENDSDESLHFQLIKK